MLENLKLRKEYGGFAFLAEDAHGVPWLKTHHHRELEINLVVRGSVTYVVGQSRYTFPQGELFWLFPGQPHRLVHRSADAQYHVVVFKPSLISSCCHSEENQLLLDERPPRNAVLHCTLSPSAYSLVCQTISSVMEGGPDAVTLNHEAGFGLSPDFCYEHRNPDFLNASLAHLLLFCWGRQRASADLDRAVRLHPSVLKALEIIRSESGEVDLESLARQCGASPAYLSRTFKKQVGVPLNGYRNTVRLERFWAIRQGPKQVTLAEAVYAAGFGSYAQFHKVFRATYNRQPRASKGDSGDSQKTAGR